MFRPDATQANWAQPLQERFETSMSWSAGSPDTLDFVEGLVAEYLPGPAWDTGLAWVLAQPASAVFLAVSLLFYLAGYRRAKPAGRFSA
jgi:hypothetical protein